MLWGPCVFWTFQMLCAWQWKLTQLAMQQQHLDSGTALDWLKLGLMFKALGIQPRVTVYTLVGVFLLVGTLSWALQAKAKFGLACCHFCRWFPSLPNHEMAVVIVQLRQWILFNLYQLECADPKRFTRVHPQFKKSHTNPKSHKGDCQNTEHYKVLALVYLGAR